MDKIMKGFKIRKKDQRVPVFVNEVKKSRGMIDLPKMLITLVHSIPRAEQMVLRLEQVA
jgi:hypothetical protein